MAKKQNRADFFGLLLIPILSALVWSWYYGQRIESTLALFKYVVIVYLICFVVGELFFWLLPHRISRVFKLGFWLGAFLIAPFYMFKISYLAVTYKFPYTGSILYFLYILSGIIGAIACGLILWAIAGIFTGIRNSRRPALYAISRLVLIAMCILLLMPIFKRDEEVQPDMMKEQTSYRGFEQRETDITPKHRVIFLGVDGADWQVLDPLLEKDVLPNFKSLMKKGRYGTLESMEPIRSPMIWTTIFTGQTPDKHGIKEWLLSYSQNRLVKAVWNILSEYNLRTTISNIPGTFPPEEFLGKEVCGFPYPTSTMNIYGWVLGTKQIKTRVTPSRQFELKLNEDGSYRGVIEVYVQIAGKYSYGMKELTLKNILIENYQEGKFGEIYGDKIEVVRFNYFPHEKRIDILPLKGSDSPLASLHENEWSDYLPVQIEPGIVGITKFRAVKLEGDDVLLYMMPFFSRSDAPRFDFTFPKTLAKDIYDLYGQYLVEMTWWSARDVFLLPAMVELINEVELTKVKVGETLFNENEWDLFIQVFTLTDRMQHLNWYFAFDEVPKEIYTDFFNSDEIESDGKIAIENAYKMADNWIGEVMKNVDLEKDIVFLVSDHGFTAGTGMQYLSGVHRLDGIYVIAGGPVQPVSSDVIQNRSTDRSVMDITRNILYMMGLPIGEDMVGDLWLDLYGSEYVALNPVTTIPTYNTEITEKEERHMLDQSAIEQLKGLGYIDGGNVEGNN